eukprot:gene9486-9650_t
MTVCGIGYFSQGSDGKDFTDWAYSAVMKGCWEGFTTAHEIGHNLGCAHDWDADWSSSERYPQYAHGFKACSLGSSTAYNTIMSYGNCGNFRSRRVALFSNPDVRYQGVNAGHHKEVAVELGAAAVAAAHQVDHIRQQLQSQKAWPCCTSGSTLPIGPVNALTLTLAN